MVRVGIEMLVDQDMRLLQDDRIGLITNPSGVDSNLRPTIDILFNHDTVELARLFAPEHGLRGNEQAGVKLTDTTDEKTGLTVRSLYESNRQLKPDMIADLDKIVYDMQDIGCRFYTRIYTLVNALEGCSEADIPMVVLDRPNPIAPLGIGGNRISPAHSSFVGGRKLPILHGMTIGEVARYFNHEFDIGAELHVVELDGWTRDTWYDELELAWVPPSPNMPTLETATIYPGTCLFEGTNFSEGRGTTKPFELIGAPWVNAEEWAAVLNELDDDGVAFRPAYFTPMFSKHERQDVEGVQIHVMDRTKFDPIKSGIKMLITGFQLYDTADWITPNGDYFIDKLTGDPTLRTTIDDLRTEKNANEVFEVWKEDWSADISEFEQLLETYSLYP